MLCQLASLDKSTLACLPFLLIIGGCDVSPQPPRNLDSRLTSPRKATDHCITDKVLGIDFGLVNPKLLETSISLKNTTDVRTKLEGDARVGCTCTRLSVTPNELEPGQTATLTVKLDAVAKKGRVAERATLKWLGQKVSLQQVVDIRAEVVDAFRLIPETIEFTEPYESKEVLIDSTVPIDFQSIQLEGTASGISFEIDTRKQTIKINYDASECKELTDLNLTVRAKRTDLEGYISAVLRVDRAIAKLLLVKPEQIIVQGSPSNLRAVATVICPERRSDSESSITVKTEGGQDLPVISCDWLTKEMCRIVLKVPDFKPNERTGRIMFFTGIRSATALISIDEAN